MFPPLFRVGRIVSLPFNGGLIGRIKWAPASLFHASGAGARSPFRRALIAYAAITYTLILATLIAVCVPSCVPPHRVKSVASAGVTPLLRGQSQGSSHKFAGPEPPARVMTAPEATKPVKSKASRLVIRWQRIRNLFRLKPQRGV